MTRHHAANFLDSAIKKIGRSIEQDRPQLSHSPDGSEKDAWQKCSELAKEHDQSMCDAYREQIDTLLVFAGLFSAVVTAFTIESYQWLQQDSNDTSALLLADILATLSGNQTAAIARPASAIPDAIAARINICWFLSLTLGLSSALVAILAKQWIREYVRDSGRQHREALSIRQMRFNGLGFWRVDNIVMSIPLLLQAALALFLLGMLELLLSLDRRVATPVLAVSGMVGLFYLATTLLPALSFLYWYFFPGAASVQCPYKSPQAWIIMRVVLGFVRSTGIKSLYAATSWVSVDRLWTERSDADERSSRPQYGYDALAWIWKTIDHQDLHLWNWHCLWVCVKTCADGLGLRASRNIAAVLSSMLADPAKVDPGTAVSAECVPEALLLSYSFATFSRPALHVELLYRIHLRERARAGRLNQLFIRWWAAQMLKIHIAQEPAVDVQTCQRLVLMLHFVVSEGVDLGKAFVDIFMMCFTAARRLDSFEDADQCDDILRVFGPLLLLALQSGYIDDETMRSRLEFATYVSATAWRHLDTRDKGLVRPLGYDALSSPSHVSRENRVFLPLVTAIEDAWLRLSIEFGPERSPRLHLFPDWDEKAAVIFRRLSRRAAAADSALAPEHTTNDLMDMFPGDRRTTSTAPPSRRPSTGIQENGPTTIGRRSSEIHPESGWSTRRPETGTPILQSAWKDVTTSPAWGVPPLVSDHWLFPTHTWVSPPTQPTGATAHPGWKRVADNGVARPWTVSAVHDSWLFPATIDEGVTPGTGRTSASDAARHDLFESAHPGMRSNHEVVAGEDQTSSPVPAAIFNGTASQGFVDAEEGEGTVLLPSLPRDAVNAAPLPPSPGSTSHGSYVSAHSSGDESHAEVFVELGDEPSRSIPPGRYDSERS